MNLRWAALRASVLLSVLFLLAYGATNWFAAQRGATRVWMYEWERHIPFLPLMILPYMSIDLFFIAAPFMCVSRRELSIFTRRIIAAILVACTIFLLLPLRLGIERTSAPGWLGALFDWFRGLDQPHNLFPSLHIALWTILLDTYWRHTSGVWRWLLVGWFILIAASTLFTHQHHLIDLFGGWALGVLCLYAIPMPLEFGSVRPSHRIASFYAPGAIAVVALAIVLWRVQGWILLWPAFSMAMVSAAYLGAGPGVFRKVNGRIEWPAKLVLAPVLIGQRLSRWHYSRQSAAWDLVTGQVWIGRHLNDSEAREARAAGVRATIDLTSEFSESASLRSEGYLNIALLDLTAPTPAQIDQALQFIEKNQGSPTLVHCKAGYSRSAAIVGAFLIASGEASDVDDALARLRRARPNIIVRSEAIEALRHFDHRCKLQKSDARAEVD